MTRVVFLNGASSAGKTSLGTRLQNRLSEPYLLLGLDTCFGMVPPRWGSGGDRRHEGFAYAARPDEDGRPVTAIEYGDVGRRILTGFHRAVVELATAGNRVIVDEMLLDEQVRDDWTARLAPLDPLLVGVYCGLDELERRERDRRNPPGLSRWSARRAHVGMDYDLTVDTTGTGPAACAESIVEVLAAAG